MYATQQDLIDRFGATAVTQLADHDGDGTIDAAVVDRALSDAADAVDSYVVKRYELPFATVPAAAIAFYFLFKDSPTEAARDGYKEAIKFLGDLASGRAELDVAGTPAPPTGAGVVHKAPERIFTDKTLDGY